MEEESLDRRAIEGVDWTEAQSRGGERTRQVMHSESESINGGERVRSWRRWRRTEPEACPRTVAGLAS